MANTEYTISRIFSEFNFGRWNIHKIGYTPDGQQVHVQSDFTDYFYFKSSELANLIPFNRLYQNDHGEYMSIYGDPTRKIEYSSIKEKNAVVKQYPESTFEADVAPEFKYLMEMPQEWTPAHERHILYFDIETWGVGNESTPERPDAPITSIQIYSSRYKKYFIFSWHPEKTKDFEQPKIIQTDEINYVFTQTEREVIESFIAFVEEYSPDILTGWYSAGFDLPYIVNRAARLNIDYNRLSPIGQVRHYQKNGAWKTYIIGLDHIDMMEAVMDLMINPLPNYKLATAAKEILKDDETEKLTEVTWKDWMDNYKGFIKYGIMDVKILKDLDAKMGIFDLYCTVQKLTNITTLGEVMFKSSVVDKYILSESQGVYVFPTRKTTRRQKYMGAHVMPPVPGLHKDVAVFDYASLYPTSIMTFNISPETFICSDKELERKGLEMDEVIKNLNARGVNYVDTGENKDLFGNRYLFYSQDHKHGVLPRILKKMYDERRAIKAQMKNVEKSSSEYYMLDKHQYAIKIILNSAYGALGFNYFRLYKPECADAITYFARQVLYFGQEKLEDFGCNVIYQDTDSEFALQNGKTRQELDMWVDEFNNTMLYEFAEQYNRGQFHDFLTLEIEYEKDLERVYFGYDKKGGEIIGTKKRYYGIMRDTNEKYIKGMNIIRKDTPEFLKDKLNVLTELAVTDRLTINHLDQIRKLIELQPLRTIGITKAFSKRFDAYEKTQPQHLTAARWANEILGTKINHTHNPYLFYVKSNCEPELKPRQRHQAICLLEEDLHLVNAHPELFELDYNTYFSKQVLEQLEELDLVESVKEVIETYRERMKNAG